jgi:hypothetical protein
MSTEIVTAPLDAVHVDRCRADGFLVVRDVFSRDRIDLHRTHAASIRPKTGPARAADCRI